MNRDKQIEEMAKDICHLGRKCPDCSRQAMCKAVNYASRFYDKGYRKASEVANKVIDEFVEKVCDKYEIFTDSDVSEYNYILNLIEETKAELKKKYTESEKDDEL